jgi:hypothetical protein
MTFISPSNTGQTMPFSAPRSATPGGPATSQDPANPGSAGSQAAHGVVVALSPQAQAMQAGAPDGLPSRTPRTLGLQPRARIELQLETRSGARIQLSLLYPQQAQAHGLQPETRVLSGSLNAAEQQALAALAQGWERTVQGLTQTNPRIDLEGLSQLGGAQITSLDLRAAVFDANGQSTLQLRYQQDRNTRSIHVDAASGKIDMAINMDTVLRNPLLSGTQAQKDKFVDYYMDRMETAARKGHAAPALTQLFRATFGAMTRTYASADSNQPATQAMDARTLNARYAPFASRTTTPPSPQGGSAEDPALLSGLADFDARLRSSAHFTNAQGMQGTDTFAYRLQQSTELGGDLALPNGAQNASSFIASSGHSFSTSFSTSFTTSISTLAQAPHSPTYDYSPGVALRRRTLADLEPLFEALDALRNHGKETQATSAQKQASTSIHAQWQRKDWVLDLGPSPAGWVSL